MRTVKGMRFRGSLILAGTLGACSAPTYHGRIEALFAERCVSCHQAGGIAPFSLTSYDEAVQWKDAIKASVEAGTMPPWPPGDGCNDYADSRALTAAQRKDIVAWVDAGATQGTRAAAPPAPAQSS